MRSLTIRKSRKSVIWLGVAVLSAVLVSVGARAANPSLLSAHVVVQFTENVSEPGAPEFIDELAARVGAPLGYVRPTGLNGHLLVVRHLKGKAELDQIMSTLSADQYVVAVKPRGQLEPERR